MDGVRGEWDGSYGWEEERGGEGRGVEGEKGKVLRGEFWCGRVRRCNELCRLGELNLGVDSCGWNTLLDILAFGAVKKLLFFLINTSLKPILGQSLGTKGCLSAVFLVIV